MNRAVAAALAAALTVGVPALGQANDLTTSFEFTDLSGSFALGTAPKRATFVGGEAKVVGIPGLYHTGMHSWMVDAGATATISFETPAESVDLWFRHQNASGSSTLTLVDTGEAPIASFQGTTGFQHVVFSVGSGSPIARIEVRNDSATGYVAVDDFTFCAQAASGPLSDPIPESIAPGTVGITLETLATGLVAPNWGTSAPGLPGRLFVTDQPGTLWSIDLTTGEKFVFLDVSSLLVPLGISGPGSFDERGLLGVAFAPDYQTSGLLYTYTSEPVSGPADFSTMPAGQTANHQSVLREWRVANPSDPSASVDPASTRILLRIDEPQFNHDGGALGFGPDGLLYVSLGDGGNADDVGTGHSAGGNGQDPGNVLGTLLRIDPFGSNSANGQYSVPADNPLAGTPGIVAEIFAFGLRNPFRFSFDRVTGQLYLADVGQNNVEEIDVLAPGGNYGWPLKEGSFFFDPASSGVTNIDPGVPAGLIDPIAEYDHDEGTAVIGGFVYRGTDIPALDGRYVFGDFSRSFTTPGGRLFYLDASGQIRELVPGGLGAFLLGMGQDADGELYAMVNQTGTPFGTSGAVVRLRPLDTLCGSTPEPAASCRQAAAGKSALLIADKADPKRDRIAWAWPQGAATAASDFANPVAGLGSFRLCIYDESQQPQPIEVLDVPPGGMCGGSSCWKQIVAKKMGAGFRYRDLAGTVSGVRRVVLRAGTAGSALVRLKAKGTNLTVPKLPLSGSVTVQLLVDDGSVTRCWQTVYPTPIRNKSTRYKAKGP